MDRASDYGSEGYRFKSCRAHHRTLARLLPADGSGPIMSALIVAASISIVTVAADKHLRSLILITITRTDGSSSLAVPCQTDQ